MTRGTSTFIRVLVIKFNNPCVPLAPSATFRFLLIGAILVLSARSNLSAFTISNVPDQVLLAGLTSGYHAMPGVILHTNVLTPNAWVKIGCILILIPTFVPGLTTKFEMVEELYTLRFCSVRLQERNHGLLIDQMTGSVHLF